MSSEYPYRHMHVGDHNSEEGEVAYTLERGDCMEVMRGMPDRSVDLFLADIPWGEMDRPSSGLRRFEKGVADLVTFDLEEFTSEATRITRGSLYVFCGSEQISTLKRLLKHGPLVSVRACVWHKTNPPVTNADHSYLSAIERFAFAKRPGAEFNTRMQPNYFKCATLPPNKRRYDAEKPQPLLSRLIQISSSPGQLVFDPCMGSGSTGEAALALGRRFSGVELHPQGYEIAKDRIREVTGRVPIPFDGVQESLFDDDGNPSPRDWGYHEDEEGGEPSA